MDKKLLPDNITLDNIHTLSGDALEAIEEQKITQAKLIAKREQEEAQVRQEREYREKQEKSGRTYKVRNILIMLATAVALVGVAVTILSFVNKESQTAPVTPIQVEKTVVPFDSKKEISFSLAEVRSDADLRAKVINEGMVTTEGVTYFKTDPEPLGILTILSPSFPDGLLRTITGVFWGGRAAGNFLVVNVDSYERAYAGLLEWESAMSRDITPIFGVLATSTTTFQDKVVENKDTRRVVGGDGQTIFLYGFYNSNIIIFAKNEEVFKSVFDSLLRQNL